MRKLVLTALLCGGLAQVTGCVVEDADDVVGDGFFELDWVLTEGGGPTTCGNVGADGVEVLTTIQNGQGVADIFDCVDMGAVTDPLPLGSYTVVVSILDAADVALGTSMPRSGVLSVDGATVDLGIFNFDFGGGPAPGDVTYTVDYDTAGGANCAGGDEVDDQETSLFDQAGGGCVPTTLEAGAENIQNICDEFPLCIENNVVQTLVQVAPGDYNLVLQGLYTNGASSTACFSVSVPVFVDGDNDLGPIIVPFDDSKDPAFCSTI